MIYNNLADRHWEAEVDWVKLGRGLEKYLAVINRYNASKYSHDDWDTEEYQTFRKRYNGFYRMRQRTQNFYKAYYQILFDSKESDISFEGIFKELNGITGRNEPSFSSKMLATINPNMPVWDKNVLNSLKVKPPAYYQHDQIFSCYNNIVDWYSETLNSAHGADMLQAFDKQMGQQPITPTKKIDLMLWQLRPEAIN